MATKKQLQKRWLEEPGKTILAKLNHIFSITYEMESGKKPTSEDLFPLLCGLPFREEVKSGWDFRGIFLVGGTGDLNLQGADFSYAVLEFNLFQCQLQAAKFDFAAANQAITGILDSASFFKAKLKGCSFDQSQARAVCFDEADLSAASLKQMDLTGSSFRKANLKEAEICNSILLHCDFREARLDEAAFLDVTLDKTTDLRGASLHNLFHQDLYNLNQERISQGVDWRKANYDETTRYQQDPSRQDLQLLQAVLDCLADYQREDPAKYEQQGGNQLKESLLREIPLLHRHPQPGWVQKWQQEKGPFDPKLVISLFTQAKKRIYQ